MSTTDSPRKYESFYVANSRDIAHFWEIGAVLVAAMNLSIKEGAPMNVYGVTPDGAGHWICEVRA